MLRLPNCAQAVISKNKIEDYLLNFDHPKGKSKAMFFGKFGYNKSNGAQFQSALRDFACKSIIMNIEEKPPFGIRITTEGLLQTPDLRNPLVRIGWFIDTGDTKNIPRLITVIPVKANERT